MFNNFANYIDPSRSKDEEKPEPLDGALWHDLQQYGNYSSQLRPFFDHFRRNRFHFIDAQSVLTNPDSEFHLIEDFLKLNHELQFSFNQTKGFPCLDKPIPFCLADSKGRSRGTAANQHPDDFAPQEIKKIREFFKPEMIQIYHLLYPKLRLKSFCGSPDSHRFAWLARFVCKKESG